MQFALLLLIPRGGLSAGVARRVVKREDSSLVEAGLSSAHLFECMVQCDVAPSSPSYYGCSNNRGLSGAFLSFSAKMNSIEGPLETAGEPVQCLSIINSQWVKLLLKLEVAWNGLDKIGANGPLQRFHFPTNRSVLAQDS